MKRIAIISLIILFLTSQYSYATCSYGILKSTKLEAQELTQEEVEEIIITLMSLIDWEILEDIDVNAIDWDNLDLIEPEITPIIIIFIIILVIIYFIFQ